MNRHTLVALCALAIFGLPACREAGPPAAENPAPTADAHEPEGANRYGTSAQDTRDPSAAERAESPNHDPDDDRPQKR